MIGKKELQIRPMVMRGEPDPASVSIDEWVKYRDHLKSLPGRDESIHIALVVAQARIQKLRQDLTGDMATR